MTKANLICWAVVLTGYAWIVYWGNSQPVKLEKNVRGTWAKLWITIDDMSLSAPGGATSERERLPRERPTPPPPPEPMTRKRATEVIELSPLRDFSALLTDRLQRSVRVSPWPVDDPAEIARGASRMTAAPDVPAGFEWPRFEDKPLRSIAQFNLAEVAAHDEQGALPDTGWLCFFFLDDAEPAVDGCDPARRDAWRVVYFDGSADELERTPRPGEPDNAYPPCYVRLWKEWTLPSLTEEPELIWNHEVLHYYNDTCQALTRRPQETGWHHLIGYAQNSWTPMRPMCELASQGLAVSDETNFEDAALQAKLAKANEWRLLFQVDLGALEVLDMPQPDGTWGGYGAHDRLFYWIRESDLAKRNFANVWLLREGDYDARDYLLEKLMQAEYGDDGGG